MIGESGADVAFLEEFDYGGVEPCEDRDALGDPGLLAAQKTRDCRKRQAVFAAQVRGNGGFLVEGEGAAPGVEGDHHGLGLDRLPVLDDGGDRSCAGFLQRVQALEAVHDLEETVCLDHGDRAFDSCDRNAGRGAARLEIGEPGPDLLHGYFSDLHLHASREASLSMAEGVLTGRSGRARTW